MKYTLIILTIWFAMGLLSAIIWSVGLLFTKREPTQQINAKEWLTIFIILIFYGVLGLFQIINEISIKLHKN